MTPAERVRLADLEETDRALRLLLPIEPPTEDGTPEEQARAAGAREVWEQVAEVLGVSLPYTVPLDEEPIPYVLATPQCSRRAASVARLRALLARQTAARRCTP